MKTTALLLLAMFTLSFDAYSKKNEINASTDNEINISSSNLQNIYAQIYKIQTEQKKYYYELREKSILENYNYLNRLKKINNSEFIQISNDRKKHLIDCSGILDESFCLYKLNLKQQLNVISDVVMRDGSVNEAFAILELSKERDYNSLKKYKKF